MQMHNLIAAMIDLVNFGAEIAKIYDARTFNF